MGGQDLPDLCCPPGTVPRFHRDPQRAVAGGRGALEGGETGVQQSRLRFESRRQLEQDRADRGAQRRGTQEPGDGFLRIPQLSDVREVPACLHRHDEAAGGPGPPAREGLLGGQPVEAGVVLHRPVGAGVVLQPLALGHPAGYSPPSQSRYCQPEVPISTGTGASSPPRPAPGRSAGGRPWLLMPRHRYFPRSAGPNAWFGSAAWPC